MTDVVLRLPDPTVGVRFFVGYQKGLNKIYSFVHGLAGWEVAKKPITFTHESLVNPLASFVVDAENGEELTPNATRLQGQFLVLIPFSRLACSQLTWPRFISQRP